ncbi:MAG: molybdopterin-guanine dinucleotide biosynthesis protein B [Proteobacteria bacterium]|nr:molybdopterin-guanine dinucleotide biosynthesis protein B [Pseudomonadota bacterium]
MVISFVGYSGSGKTTLIEKIINILVSKGYKIGTIKHTHHNFEIDRPGKDSYRHFHSGAYASMIVSNDKFALIKRGEDFTSKDLIERYLSDCHMVIVEGFKDDETTKIEVYRKELNKEPLYKKLKNVVAVASDVKFTDIKFFDINSPEDIAKFIISLLNEEKNY